MIQGVAEVGAAAVALRLLRVAIIMAAPMGARLTGVAVGSAPEVASEVEVAMLASPRDIGAGAVELFHWRTTSPTREPGFGTHIFPSGNFTIFSNAEYGDMMT